MVPLFHISCASCLMAEGQNMAVAFHSVKGKNIQNFNEMLSFISPPLPPLLSVHFSQSLSLFYLVFQTYTYTTDSIIRRDFNVQSII